MKLFGSKKRKLIAAGVGLIAVAGMATGAFAYWTSTGSGTGSASTTSADSSLLITQTSTNAGLAPGVAAGAITGTIQNTSATQSEHVGSVTVSIASVTGPNITVSAPCDATDYTLSTP